MLHQDAIETQEAMKSVPNIACGHCGENLYYELPTYEYWDNLEVCRHCKRRFKLRIGTLWIRQGQREGEGTTIPPFNSAGEMRPGGVLLENTPVVAPEIVQGLNSPHIPSTVAQAMQEAIKGIEWGLCQSAAVMCRVALQAALLEKGIPESSPMRMIDTAKCQGLLSAIAVSRCRALVFIGNSGAHPQVDLLKNIGLDDVIEGAKLTKRVLLELFDPIAISNDD